MGEKSVTSQGLITLAGLRFQLDASPNFLQQSQIDQGIDQGIDVYDGIAISKMRTFNAKVSCLTVNSFSCRALVINFFVYLALSVK